MGGFYDVRDKIARGPLFFDNPFCLSPEHGKRFCVHAIGGCQSLLTNRRIQSLEMLRDQGRFRAVPRFTATDSVPIGLANGSIWVIDYDLVGWNIDHPAGPNSQIWPECCLNEAFKILA